jgi:kumamolisin
VGFINPVLYGSAACRDITEGNNVTALDFLGYSAKPGWDACSGLGVPDGMKLLLRSEVAKLSLPEV